MKIIHPLTVLSAVLATGLFAATALAATAARPAPAAAPKPGYNVKLTNGDTQAVSAVYASPAGKNDWGEDLLGRQTAAPGKTVTLNFKLMPAELCMQDLQLLMTDGKTLTKEKVDVCQTVDYRFTP